MEELYKIIAFKPFKTHLGMSEVKIISLVQFLSLDKVYSLSGLRLKSKNR